MTDQQELLEMVQSPFVSVRESLARQNLPADVLMQLVLDPEVSVRGLLAVLPDLPDEVRTVLATDPHPRVRELIQGREPPQVRPGQRPW